jgi:hypothetical protein
MIEYVGGLSDPDERLLTLEAPPNWASRERSPLRAIRKAIAAATGQDARLSAAIFFGGVDAC